MTDPTPPSWERATLERLALRALDEQRRARQWSTLIRLLWLTLLFRRTRSTADRAALWPFAFGLFSFVGPIAWCYHYLASAAFAPMLMERLRPLTAVVLLGTFVMVTSPFTLAIFDIPKVTQLISLGLQTSGTLMIALLLVAFYVVRNVRPRSAAGQA